MGICSKAKEIIYSSKLCDVNLKPKEKEGDNLIINSIPNTNNNTFNVDNNVINVVNINNKIIKKESKKDKKEERKKLDDEDNSIENKDKTDIEDKSSKNHHKLKRKRYSHNKNSSKLVFKSSKDVKVNFKIESDIQNFNKLKDESNDNDQNGNQQKKL